MDRTNLRRLALLALTTVTSMSAWALPGTDNQAFASFLARTSGDNFGGGDPEPICGSSNCGPGLRQSFSSYSSAQVNGFLGGLSGSVNAFAAAPAAYNDLLSSAHVYGRWDDTVFVTSSTLAAGMPVEFLVSFKLTAGISDSGPKTGTSPGYTPSFASAGVSFPGGGISMDTRSGPLSPTGVSRTFIANVGDSFAMYGVLEMYADGNSNASSGSYAAGQASASARFSMIAVTQGGGYAAVGNYAPVPEPGNALMMFSGLVVIAGAIRRRRTAISRSA